jgi:hypothetical protein
LTFVEKNGSNARVRELGLRAAQRVLDVLAILDVDEEAVPLRWLSVGRVAQLAGHVELSVHAVGASQSVLVFERCTGCDRAHPVVDRSGSIVRVDNPSIDARHTNPGIVSTISVSSRSLA